MNGDVIDLGGRRVPTVSDQHQQIVQSNVRLIGQLGLLGKQLNVATHIQAAVEVLIDIIVGDDPEELEQFHLAVDTNLHGKLLEAVKQAGG